MRRTYIHLLISHLLAKSTSQNVPHIFDEYNDESNDSNTGYHLLIAYYIPSPLYTHYSQHFKWNHPHFTGNETEAQ